MKKINPFWMAFGMLAILALSFSFTVKHFDADSKVDQMVKDWERAKAYTKEYLDAAGSTEVITSKPTPDMRSFGQQMLHLAEANYFMASAGAGKQPPITFGQLEKNPDQYKTKEALSKAVLDSYDYVMEAIRTSDQSKWSETVKLFNTFDITREAAFHKAFEHQTHHRGQTTVYLRLMKVTPPQEKLF